MAVISVVGTSGVGKSFLVKQLAAATCSPALFEGEEGTVPEEILNNVFKNENPIKRWEFFMNRYKSNLTKARSISAKGIDCFVDGANISPLAILPYEDKKYHEELEQQIAKLNGLDSDIITLLTANDICLNKLFKKRNRKTEGVEAIERALKIQENYRKLKHTIEIDRSDLDFTKLEDIEKVLGFIF